MSPIWIGVFVPVPLVVSLVSLIALVPIFLLLAELVTHRVIISPTSVTDHTWRGHSTTDGSSDSYTVLDRPSSLFRLRRRARPTMISWTDTEDNVHALSFMWFSARAAIDIIAGVHALDD